MMPCTITREDLHAQLGSPSAPTILEALPAKYFYDRHLPGALHMPHDQVAELAPGLLGEKDADIVVYCASATCRNSHIAAQALEDLGYTNISVYAEGKADWIAAGLPTETGGAAERAA